MTPLHVAVIWHMHQPWYRDGATGRFLLPWARLHASKDYGRMMRLACELPELRISMTMAPSLLEQLDACVHGAEDPHRDLCLRPAADLSVLERRFLVRLARATGFPHRVAAFAPLLELLHTVREGSVETAAAAMTTADMRDLQVWSMLAWIDPEDIAADATLRDVCGRGRQLREDDKRVVDERQSALVHEVLPSWRRAVESGVIEPLATPAYHPILPLLVASEAARVAVPDLPLPSRLLRRPEDAAEQVLRGLSMFAAHSGMRPRGMWPSECAVSPAAAAVMRDAGLDWAVSDEGVLAHTLGGSVRDGAAPPLYGVWRERSGLHMVFRDAVLSNLIGFDYPRMDSRAAVGDLVARLLHIDAQRRDDRPLLVVIALDGENCWEHYEEDGNPFLRGLYAALTSHPRLQSTHVGTFLDAHPGAVRELPELWSGSWIDASFTTWIGDREHSAAWDLLAEARDAIDSAGGAAAHPDAYREMLVAEGSDWFWWYGRRHDSGMDEAWDELFRTHLRSVYAQLGVEAPAALAVPIIGRASPRDRAPRAALVAGGSDGGDDAGVWEDAGVLEVGSALGAMHPPRSAVARILYGCDGERLRLRFGDEAASFGGAEVVLWRGGGATGEPAARVVLVAESAFAHLRWSGVGEHDAGPVTASVGEGGAVEVGIPVALVGAASGDAVAFRVTLDEPGRGHELVPANGAAVVDVPGESLRVVMVASELMPFAGAGPFGAAVAGLASAVRAQGHECTVITPLHRDDGRGAPRLTEMTERLDVPFDGRVVPCRLLEGWLPDTGVSVIAVDCPAFFDRARVHGEWDDDGRYVYLSRAACAVMRALDLRPDVVHAHAWDAALVPAVLRAHHDDDPALRRAATVLTVHDAAAEGVFGPVILQLAGLGDAAAGAPPVSMLTAGIDAADAVAVVRDDGSSHLDDLVASSRVLASLRRSPLAAAVAHPDRGSWVRSAEQHAQLYRVALRRRRALTADH